MLNRLHTLCFEAEEGAGLPEVDDTPDTDVDETPAAIAGIDYEAPEFQEAVQRQLEAMVQSAAAYQQGEEQPTELDPYGDPQGTIEAFRSIVQQELSQIQPTVQAFEDQQNQAKIEEWAGAIPAIKETQEMLGEAAEDLPEGVASMAVQFMATGYLRDLEERYGPGERAVRGALGMAADQLKQIVKASHDAGYQARNNELRGLTNAPQPPVVAGARESVQIEDQPKDEIAAADAWINRRALQ